MKDHYEMLSARKYYGQHATGSVLLRNGSVEFHGTTKEVKKMFTHQSGKIMGKTKKKAGNAFDAYANKKVKTKSTLERILDNKLARRGVEVERCEFCDEEFEDCRCD
jgi:hypothetical protein